MKKLFLFFIAPLSFGITIAQNVAIGTTTPAASAALDITSNSQGFLPPRLTEAQRDLINPVEGLMIYNTTTKIPNYYDGFEWRKFDGSLATNYSIGAYLRGGTIAYILQPGDPGYIAGQVHGLIVSPVNQSTLAQYGCIGTLLTGADGTALGTGNQNTIDFIAGCPGLMFAAARLCGDLTLNGYSDWFLPSKDELNKLYINRVAIGGFSAVNYWSSTESSADNAWAQSFNTGTQVAAAKNLAYYVRAIRSF